MTFTNPNADDVYVDGETLTYSITGTSGGNYESLNTSSTVDVVVSDTTDDTTLTLNDVTVSESDGGTATITASLDNAPETELVVTLSNGATITFAAGATTATSTAFAINNDEDVYVDGSSFELSVSSTSGGNFENLVTTDTSTVTVNDTTDTTTVTLASSDVNEGADITITASVDNAPQTTDLVITLDNGEQITIAVGQTTGSVTFVNTGSSGDALTYAIAGTSGGNYEALDTTDTVDVVVSAPLSASASDVVADEDDLVDGVADNESYTSQINVSGGAADIVSAVIDSSTSNNGTWTVTADGLVTYTLTGAYNHSAGDGQNTAENVDSITITVTDSNGDTAQVTLNADIVDDVPTISPTGFGSLAAGNTVSAVDLQSLFGADGSGATVFVDTLNGSAVLVSGQQVFFNGATLTWSVSGSIATAITQNGDTAITIELNNSGDYDVSVADGVFYLEGDEQTFDIGSLSGSNADAYIGAATGDGAIDIFITASNGLGSETTNTSSAGPGYVGAGSQWIDSGTNESVTFEFLEGVTGSGALSGQAAIDTALENATVAGVSEFSVAINTQGNSSISVTLTFEGVDGATGTLTVNIPSNGPNSPYMLTVNTSDITWTDSDGNAMTSDPAIASVTFNSSTTDYRVGGSLVFSEIVPSDIPLELDVEITDSDGDESTGTISGTITSTPLAPSASVDALDAFADCEDYPDGFIGIVNGTLLIIGTGVRDYIQISDDGDRIKISWKTEDNDVFEGDIGNFPGFTQHGSVTGGPYEFYIDKDDYDHAIVRGNPGNDYIQVDVNESGWIILGDDGDDFLQQGQAAAVIFGGDGDDDIQGGAGTNYIAGGAGNDTVQGQGSVSSDNLQDAAGAIYGDNRNSTSVDYRDAIALRDQTFNGTLSTSSAPIAIDLDGNGLTYLDRDAGVTFTDALTGETVNTGWVAPSDGILVIDLHEDGAITTRAEYVFTEWSDSAQTDLEAIAEVFDTNQDGVLDAQDERFDQFAVWQDHDSDGVTDEGELTSLTDLGIESIELTYREDSESRVDGDGDVAVFGQVNVNFEDGSTTTAEDVSFAVEAADLLSEEDDLTELFSEEPIGERGEDLGPSRADAAAVDIAQLELTLNFEHNESDSFDQHE